MATPDPQAPITAQAMQAQAAHQDELLNKNNVVGVAVGYKESDGVVTDQVAVVVLVQEKRPLAALSAQDVIPKQVDGLLTDVIEVGYLRAQQTPRERFRPVIPSGVSIGHYKITAGTLGTLVKDRRTGDMLILSNNHVIANSNDAVIGDAITQPGPMDGGNNPADVVAKLERFVRLRFTDEPADPPVKPPPSNPPPTTPDPNATGCNIIGILVAIVNFIAALLGSGQRVTPVPPAGTQTAAVDPAPSASAAPVIPTNLVDAAVARPVDPAMFADEIRQIGVVNVTKAPALGMQVRKYGRTTELTTGTINLMNATVDIAYSTVNGQKTARFTGQCISSAMSQGGDSGSLIVDAAENKAVGLLYGGSQLATIFTPIDTVLNALDITL
jgi:hypothetical protein